MMNLKDEEKKRQLEEFFARLGANQKQAQTMAAQLLKRARQVAEERSVTEEEALVDLIQQIARAREGEHQ